VNRVGDTYDRLAWHGFEEVRRAAASLSLSANLWSVMRGDKDDRHRSADLAKVLLQIQT
jgi:hypothetical protein